MKEDPMKTLIIDGTGRNESQSKTKYLANRVIKKLNLSTVQYVDLYEIEVPFVTKDIIDSWQTQNRDTQSLKILTQFEQADQYIFIYPTWNWTVPAVVKAYMDLVLISGRTFGYDHRGKKHGLLKDKKAVLISTTGGKSYSRIIASVIKAQDGDNYMVQMLKTMGINNIKKYSIDNTAYKFNNKNGVFSMDLYDKKVCDIINKIN